MKLRGLNLSLTRRKKQKKKLRQILYLPKGKLAIMKRKGDSQLNMVLQKGNLGCLPPSTTPSKGNTTQFWEHKVIDYDHNITVEANYKPDT